MKRLISLILALTLAFGLIPGALAADGPAVSSNIDDHFYINAGRFYHPIYSNLAYENGQYVRAEAIGSELVVETYDRNFNFLSGKSIPLELPVFGGVRMDTDYNFVVVGQDNLEEDDSVEVFRIIRYTKDWVKVDHASLFGANTYIPFDAGSLRFDRSGDILYIRTAHEMYDHGDGLHHQANVMIALRISDMTVTDELTEVLNRNYGYISHSFNQFVRVDGDTLLAVDHGDALPRSVVLIKYGRKAGEEQFYGRVSYVNALPIANSTGHYNDTGVSVGGFECSSTDYLIAGSAYDMSETVDLMYAHRNIFVTVTPKDNFTDEGTVLRWITNYSESDGVEVSPPHLLKLSADRFFLIWTEDGIAKYCFLNGRGELEGEITTHEGDLSDCVPILAGENIVWYVTDRSEPVFHKIELNPHVHSYEAAVTEPTCMDGGFTTYTCTECGHSYTADETAALGHDWGEWEAVQSPTCAENGTEQRACTRCGETESRTSDALGHHWESVVTAPTCTERGYTTHTCTRCGAATVDSYTEPTGHQEVLLEAKPATCTETGLNEGLICGVCGLVFKAQSETPALGHDLGEYEVTQPQSCVEDGLKEAHCSRCDYVDVQVIPADGNHNYCIEVEESRVEPTCTVDGSVQMKCACGEISPTPKILHAMGHHCPEWTVVREATCTRYGSMEAPCVNCDEFVDTKAIPMLGHLWDGGTVTTEPTDLTDGVMTYTCTREGCGDTYTEVIPALGHTHTPERVNAEECTCVWDGYTGDLICTGCGMVLEKGQVIEAPGHAYGHWELLGYPSAESSGFKQQICTVCGEGTSSGVMYPEEPHENGYDIVILDSKYSYTDTNITAAVAGHHVFLEISPREGYYVEAIYYGSSSEDVVIEEPRFYGDYLYFTMPEGDLYVQIVCRSILDDGRFQDVDPESFYYDPFLWALENNITNGLDASHFGPTAPCNRAQVVTFLWRAAGCPEPTSTENPFVDVKPGDFFHKAVLWAVENGITNGLDTTHFGPTASCNRAQVVTFLWRTMGRPGSYSARTPFTDVKAGDFYYEAVLWAVENGVTNGLSATEFGVNSVCNRAQIVTFLYRTFA